MFRKSNGQPYDTPFEYVLGIDGMCYAVLPDEYEAEDFLYEFGGVSIACCNGYMNGVQVTETLGM
jgi:hypothetical protein